MLLQNIGAAHASFDAWNTVLIPSKVYAQERTRILAEAYDVPEDVARKAYTRIKKELDESSETTGVGRPVEEAYALLDEVLTRQGRSVDIHALRERVTACFAKHPPKVLADTVSMLVQLTELGVSVGILSNTNFIGGATLRACVFNLLPVQFSTMHFSDECGYSKPAPQFFRMMFTAAQAANPRVRALSDVVHVGDNARADGSVPDGMRALILKDPYDLPHLFKEVVNA